MDWMQGWVFYPQDGDSRQVCMPHDAMLEKRRDPVCGNGKNTGYFPGGRYVYKKTFSIEKTQRNQYIAVHFEGVYGDTEVFLNGTFITRHRNGYTGFLADLTDRVRIGQNELTVMVNNCREPNSRWYSGSGIYRPVSLIVKNRERLGRVRIKTLSCAPARIEVAVDAKNASVSVYDGKTLVACGKPGVLEIPDARLWSAEHPYLYTCAVTTDTDETRVRFGIRTLTWSADDGLQVNGETVKLRGGCIHHDNGVLGACCFRDAERRKVRILKEAGYNAIRSAHNPCSRYLLEACDELGMYVIDEAFDGWYIPKTYHDGSRCFDEEWESVLTAMVEKDDNHPSVVLYSIGNEVMESAQERGIELADRMAALLRRLDGTRPVTCGINPMLNVLAWWNMGIYKDSGSYDPNRSFQQKDQARQKSGSALFNLLMQQMNWITGVLAKSKSADKAIREAAEKLDVMGLNYAGERYEGDAAKYPHRLMVGSETMISDLPENWARVKRMNCVIGDFCWTAWDYLGEAGIGEWQYSNETGLPLLAGCGAIDLIGTPGAENGFQQIVWGIRKEPYIAVRPLHRGQRPRKGRWRITDALPSWSWQGYEGKPAVIEVYSAGKEVTLTLNGRKLATKRVKNFRAVFQVPYEAGTLTAADDLGNTDTLRSAGKEVVLYAVPDVSALSADGQSLCFIHVFFGDSNGIRMPAIEKDVTCTVTGCGALQGAGTGRVRPVHDFREQSQRTWNGEALFVVRCGETPGEMKAVFHAEGCEDAVCSVAVVSPMGNG